MAFLQKHTNTLRSFTRSSFLIFASIRLYSGSFRNVYMYTCQVGICLGKHRRPSLTCRFRLETQFVLGSVLQTMHGIIEGGFVAVPA